MSLEIRCSSASIPATQLSVKALAASPNVALTEARCTTSSVCIHSTQNVLGFRQTDSGVITEDMGTAIVSASACVGLTFPGMIELPGSFAGKISSPRPSGTEFNIGVCRWRS